MPIAAQCPNCGGPLSETSVLALAPVCERCGTVITKIGGTLGLTSAYGVNDPTITRKRVEADFAVFCDYRNKSVGMLEACKEQLNWGVERYAKLPSQPELLPLQDVPPFSDGFQKGFWGAFLVGVPCVGISIWPLFAIWVACQAPSLYALILNIPLLGSIFAGGALWYYLFIRSETRPHYKAKAANGNRPSENARRQKAYEQAVAAALKAAEPLKAAQDHRLRCQIRELEGLIKTYTEKEEDLRGLLQTL